VDWAVASVRMPDTDTVMDGKEGTIGRHSMKHSNLHLVRLSTWDASCCGRDGERCLSREED